VPTLRLLRVATVFLLATLSGALSFQPQSSAMRAEGSSLQLRPTAARVELGGVQHLMRGWVRDYGAFVEGEYLLASGLQSAALRSAANVAAQTLMLVRGTIQSFDISQTIAMGLIGVSVSGVVKAAWGRRLEMALGNGRTDAQAVVSKALANLVVWAPIAGCSYLLGVPLLRGKGWAVALQTLQTQFAQLMLLEATVFTPYNLFSFWAIPMVWRPQAHSCVAAAYTVFLSMRT